MSNKEANIDIDIDKVVLVCGLTVTAVRTVGMPMIKYCCCDRKHHDEHHDVCVSILKYGETRDRNLQDGLSRGK